MSQTTNPNPDAMSEALLITLYIRAMESQRPDALLKDEKAVALVKQLGFDAARMQQADVQDEVAVSVVLRNREFDRHARDFLARSSAPSCRGSAGLARSSAPSCRGSAGLARGSAPSREDLAGLAGQLRAVVVHIGCGLDSRFERVDNGQVEWYDLDLPEAIELRRKLLGGEAPHYHQLACSVLDSAWMDTVSVHAGRPFLFLAEGVFMFLGEVQVKSLLQSLAQRFPGCELVFDAFSPFYLWANNRRVARSGVGAQAHWALKRPQDLQGWGHGIRLLDEWYPFLCPEPRLGHARWVRYIPGLSKVTGVYHYRLGNPSA